jgi:hypothetical protein
LVVLAPGFVTTGATFTSFTVIVMVSESIAGGAPLSVTRTVVGNDPGPCASVGVHVKAPDAPLIEAPAGAPVSSEKVNV